MSNELNECIAWVREVGLNSDSINSIEKAINCSNLQQAISGYSYKGYLTKIPKRCEADFIAIIKARKERFV